MKNPKRKLSSNPRRQSSVGQITGVRTTESLAINKHEQMDSSESLRETVQESEKVIRNEP